MVTRHTFPNGLTVLVNEDHSTPVAAVLTHVKTGYFDEEDRYAVISHLLEHMYFKGTPRRPGPEDIARATKAAGGKLEFSGSLSNGLRQAAGIPVAPWEVGHPAFDAGR